jgi:hypothetical protein
VKREPAPFMTTAHGMCSRARAAASQASGSGPPRAGLTLLLFGQRRCAFPPASRLAVQTRLATIARCRCAGRRRRSVSALAAGVGAAALRVLAPRARQLLVADLASVLRDDASKQCTTHSGCSHVCSSFGRLANAEEAEDAASAEGPCQLWLRDRSLGTPIRAVATAVAKLWRPHLTSTASRIVSMYERLKYRSAAVASASDLKPIKPIWRERPSLRCVDSRLGHVGAVAAGACRLPELAAWLPSLRPAQAVQNSSAAADPTWCA